MSPEEPCISQHPLFQLLSALFRDPDEPQALGHLGHEALP